MPIDDPRQDRKSRILLVDDQPDIITTLSTLFRMVGFEVMGATNGRDALKIAAEFCPNVILLDIGLPILNGYQVARRLRAESAMDATPIIAMTGYGDVEHRERSREAGFDCHLVKPVGFDVLLKTFSRFGVRPGPSRP